MAAIMVISFMLLMTGISMIIIWIMDIGKNPDVDLSAGFFRAREKKSGNIFWYHIVAEVVTGILLIASGIILIIRDFNSFPVVYFALGALFYSSMNSMGWAFAEKERRRYAIPMITALLISVLSLITLFA